MNRCVRIYGVVAVLAALLACSCTQVSMLPRINDNYVDTQFRFDWGTQTAYPDSMTIVTTRTEQELHYMFGHRNSVPAEEADTNKVIRGEYFFVAFGSDQDEFLFPDLEQFLTDRTFPIKQLYASQRTYIPDDVPEGEKELALRDTLIRMFDLPEDINFEDFAPRTKAIRCNAPMYVANTKCNMDPAEFTTVEMAPSRATCSVNFTLPLKIEDSGVEVYKILASITGVSDKLYMMGEQMERKDLARTFFELADRGNGTYTGHIDTFGIFSPDSPSFVGGPGLLYLYLYTNQPDELGHYTYRITRNLWGTLGSNSNSGNVFVTRLEFSDRYVLRSRNVNLTLPAVTISRAGGGDLQFGWEDMPDIEIEDGGEINPPGGFEN